MMSRDATTGELIWAYNITPADPWDIDEPINTPLVDIDVNGDGTVEHTAMKAARSGWFYVWDRSDGQLLSQPWAFVYTDAITGVDMTTGRALYDINRWTFTDAADRQRYTDYEMPGAAARGEDFTGTEVDMCPGNSARNWENDTYSNQTGLFYVSTDNTCFTEIVVEGEYVAGEGYTLRQSAGVNPNGARRALDGSVTDVGGALLAINPVTSEIAWSVDSPSAERIPVSSTGGGLVLQGNPYDGTLDAYNAQTGELVWSFSSGTDFTTSPITYMHDGKQYIAFLTSSGHHGTNGLVNPDDPTDAAQRYHRGGATLYVFALPDAVAGGM